MESKLARYLSEEKESEDIRFYDELGQYSLSEFSGMISDFQSYLELSKIEEKSNIIVLMGNSVRAIAVIIALLNCNFVPVPVSISTPKALLERYADHVDASAYISLDDDQNIKLTFWDGDRNNHNNPDTSLIMFTSGTAGRIKAVELSDDALISTVSSVVSYMNCGKGDCFFVLKDYVHCSCLISEIFVALVSGAKICLYNPRSPLPILRKKIEEHRATIIGVNPWLIEMLCRQKRYIDHFRSVRLLISSGSVLPAELKSKIMRIFPFSEVINVYGMTEACSRVCAQIPGMPVDNLSVGKPVNGVEIVLRPYKNGVSEILIRSKGNMLGYYNDKELTQDKIKDGMICSGDTGYFDDDNNLVVLGRIDDLIISASNKVDPVYVDNVIRQFPGVKDVYTFGISDHLLGEKVVSIVEHDFVWNDLSYMELMGHCRSNLLSFECPVKIVPVDAIPRTISGKVIKAEALSLISK